MTYHYARAVGAFFCGNMMGIAVYFVPETWKTAAVVAAWLCLSLGVFRIYLGVKADIVRTEIGDES